MKNLKSNLKPIYPPPCPKKRKNNIIMGIAGENINKYDVICLEKDGKLYKCRKKGNK